MKRHIFLLTLAILLAQFPCHAGGIGTLMQVGKSMDEIQRVYDEETATYNKVKEAIDKGEISKGVAQDSVTKYGEPAAIVAESIRNRQIWVYRPGTTDLLNKPKIRLFFGENNVLDEIRVSE